MRDNTVPDQVDRTLGCLLGGALGDALGAPIEFLDLDAIQATYGPRGIEDLAPAYGRTGAITDDTQMTLFTAEGLLRALVRQRERGICSIPSVVHHAYMRWLLTQGERPRMEVGTDGWLFDLPELHRRRAPGNTCVGALSIAEHFGDVARNDSKGCGGVMRVAPVGLLGPLIGSPTQVFELAVETAALTHGHVTGSLAAGHFAVMIASLTAGEPLTDAIGMASRELRSHSGADETLRAVEAALDLAATGRPTPSRLERLGGGWIAEEALAIAICCALAAESFVDGVRLAVNHSGDSDSTGAMAGNLLGARFGRAALPLHWLTELELRSEMERIAGDLARLSTGNEVSRKDCESYPGW